MTDAKTQLTTIRDTLAASVPALLTAASLSDFSEYKVGAPTNASNSSLAVYLSRESYLTDLYEIIFIVQAQLPGRKAPEDYHAVLFQALQDLITPTLLGLERLDSIESDIYPIDMNTGGSFIFYDLDFQQDLDDCD